MKQFLVTLPGNLAGCFKGRRIVWHVIAIVLTFIAVTSGFDWRYFLATRSPTLRAWMFPAVHAGMLLPVALPLILFALGIIARNARAILTGWAVAQAALLGLLIALLTVRTRVTQVRRTRVDFEYEVVGPTSAALCRGTTVLACISASTRRPCELPEEMRAMLEKRLNP